MGNEIYPWKLTPPVKFQWKGNHHGYYGIFFVVFGFFNIYMSLGNGALVALIPLWGVITGLGGYLIIDDVIEHTITADTPARVIFRQLFKVKE
jgi:hypothetical protein